MIKNLSEIVSNNIPPNNIVKIIGYCASLDNCTFIRSSKQTLFYCKKCGNLICNSCTNKNFDKCVKCSEKNSVYCCNKNRTYYLMCWECGKIIDRCETCYSNEQNPTKKIGVMRFCNDKCLKNYYKIF